MSYGERLATDAISQKLRDLFPKAQGVDFDVIAAELVRASDLAAAVDHREQAMEKAMMATMAYFDSVIKGLRERVAELEGELTSERLRAARHMTLVPSEAAGQSEREDRSA